MPHFLDLLTLHLVHLFSLVFLCFMQISVFRRRSAAFGHFFCLYSGDFDHKFCPKLRQFFSSPERYILLNLSYFLVPRLPKNSNGHLGLYTPLRSKSDILMQELLLHAILPSHMIFHFAWPVLSIHPFFFRPSVCPSISLSVSLPPVSWTVHLLKLLVSLSARVPALPSAGIPVLMLGCQLHNYVCLLTRTSVFPS